MEERGNTQNADNLQSLEASFKKGELEAARALRLIRNNKWWQKLKLIDGEVFWDIDDKHPTVEQMFKTFDEYCGERLGITRQAVTHKTNWLATVEQLAELRAKGHKVPDMISASAAEGLDDLDKIGTGFLGKDGEAETYEAGLLLVLQEAQEDGVGYTKASLGRICSNRLKFLDDKPKAKTYAEYKKDLVACAPLKDTERAWYWPQIDEAIKNGNDLEAAIRQSVYKNEKGQIPDDQNLTQWATGEGLQRIVAELLELKNKLADLENDKHRSRTANQLAKTVRIKRRDLENALGFKGKGKAKGDGAEQDDEDDDDGNPATIPLDNAIKDEVIYVEIYVNCRMPKTLFEQQRTNGLGKVELLELLEAPDCHEWVGELSICPVAD